MKIVNIDWDIGVESITEAFESKTISEIARSIDIPLDKAVAMTIEELQNYVFNVCYDNKYAANKFVGLPDSVDIDEDTWSEEDITNYLSDTFEFCVNGWEYAM